MLSLGPEKVLGNMFLGNIAVFFAMASTGRSGSIFFKTSDGKFLLKTITIQEELVARESLFSYYNHVTKYKSTLLARVLGIHMLSRCPSCAQDTRLLVMSNIFDTPLQIHEQYDLKGSTIGRHVEETAVDIAMKDLDFHRKINLGPGNKALLLEQLEHDCKFLEQLNLCDYSFLVGIHVVNECTHSDHVIELGHSIFRNVQGGIKSIDGKEIYFMAIIDTLTTWDFRKKSEKAFKSLFHNVNDLSAIPPAPYRARFQKYVCSIVE